MSYPKLTPIIAKGATEPRYLEDRFADIVNVKDFGAKGDGTTDDTEAVQAAFTHAGTSKCVFFPAGTYITSGVTASCDILGSGIGSTTLKISSNAGESPAEATTPCLTWSGDQLQKTISNIMIEADDGYYCLMYTGSGRISLENVYVNLLGDGVGVYIKPYGTTDWHYAISRLCRFNNVSILGRGSKTNVGLIMYNAIDSRLVNVEVMGCQKGIIFRAGTSHIFMSDIHIWCGDTTRSDSDWWSSTEGIQVVTPMTITATNLYLDCCKVCFVASHPMRLFIKNFTYWDGVYWEYLDGISGQMFYFNSDSAKNNSYVEIDGCVIDTRFHMLNPFNIWNMKISSMSVVLPESFTFSNQNLRLPKSYISRTSKWAILLKANKYTPVAYIYSQYGGFCRFELSGTTGGGMFDIRITGSNSIRCETQTTPVENLYYSYDTTNHVMTLYQYAPSDGVEYINILHSDMNHFLFMTDDMYLSDEFTKFSGEALDSASGLTAVPIIDVSAT